MDNDILKPEEHITINLQDEMRRPELFLHTPENKTREKNTRSEQCDIELQRNL